MQYIVNINVAMSWTEEKTAQLKKLWSEGHTASQIARMLGDDISRNAVIGKAHRLNLAGRTQSRMISSPKINNHQSQNKKDLIRRTRRPRGLRAIVIEKDFEPENPTSLENLTDKTCSWPIGHPDEKDFYFCGRSPMEEKIYCKLHVLHAYQPRGQKGEVPQKRSIAKKAYQDIVDIASAELFGEEKTLLFVQALDGIEYKIDYSKEGTSSFIKIHQNHYM